MAEPPNPPAPPPSQADGTPDGGNPGHAVPPEVKPKPGRVTEKDRAAPKPPRKRASPKPSAAAKPPSPRRAARPKPVAPKRPRPAEREAATPTEPKPVDVSATDPATRKRGRWFPAFAGAGVLAAGAALLSLRGSSRRRKAHQADETDSSESFEAGIADEGTIPDEPAKS